MDAITLNQLREAEESHLLPEIRADHNKLSDILDDTFTEIGASGTLYTKASVLEALHNEQPCMRTIEEFQARQLSAGLFLTTYIIEKHAQDNAAPTRTHRCTIWHHANDTWRMLYHQGTPIQS